MRGRPRWGGPAGFVIWREYHQPHHRQATEMPQKAAFREGRRIIQAWEADDDVWSEARAASRSGDLVMPCCEVRATAKTSHLGFRFFAHRPVPDKTCLWADQSTEHERLKAAANCPVLGRATLGVVGQPQRLAAGEHSAAGPWLVKHSVAPSGTVHVCNPTGREFGYLLRCVRSSGLAL